MHSYLTRKRVERRGHDLSLDTRQARLWAGPPASPLSAEGCGRGRWSSHFWFYITHPSWSGSKGPRQVAVCVNKLAKQPSFFQTAVRHTGRLGFKIWESLWYTALFDKTLGKAGRWVTHDPCFHFCNYVIIRAHGLFHVCTTDSEASQKGFTSPAFHVTLLKRSSSNREKKASDQDFDNYTYFPKFPKRKK